MGQVNVTINDKHYRMACDDGEEAHLAGLAERLNESIEALRERFGEIGDQRLTVMAAITFADQAAEAQRRIAHLEHQLSEAENARRYGKCSNPHGHGHNYVVEIGVSGDVDLATGMIVNLADLDGFVEREVLEAFDHRSLNDEVPAFRENVPTTENLCIEIYRRLRAFPKARLERVRVEETNNNSFEYLGDVANEVPIV